MQIMLRVKLHVKLCEKHGNTYRGIGVYMSNVTCNITCNFNEIVQSDWLKYICNVKNYNVRVLLVCMLRPSITILRLSLFQC